MISFVVSQKKNPSLQVQLLEYDMRFERYGSEFTFYDYNEPEDLPLELKHCFNIIVADPPYLRDRGLSYWVCLGCLSLRRLLAVSCPSFHLPSALTCF
ncbi:hypothetical protein YC2023_030785 [Brassica napus]